MYHPFLFKLNTLLGLINHLLYKSKPQYKQQIQLTKCKVSCQLLRPCVTEKQQSVPIGSLPGYGCK